jgi:hypothetical protein
VIRTLDPLVPNEVRYQAALHSDDLLFVYIPGAPPRASDQAPMQGKKREPILCLAEKRWTPHGRIPWGTFFASS